MSNIFAKFIFQSFNNVIVTFIFPAALKLANAAPVFKKASRNSRENYRPVSVLPNVSKIYKRLLFDQINAYFEGLFSKYQCVFRKWLSSQYCLKLEKICNSVGRPIKSF